MCAASPALADCTDEVRALFDEGGAMNAFSRPPHMQLATNYTPDGHVMSVLHSRVETPLRTISRVGDATECTLATEDAYWMGACWDGPWTGMSGTFLPGRGEMIRARMAEEQANLSEVECLGTADLDGQVVNAYRYRTQTGTVEDSTLAGGLYTIFVDDALGQIVRWEVDDIVTPWKMVPDGERAVVDITYDASIKIITPEL